MAVQDLWLSRSGERTARYGRGLRYRVVVVGHPSKAFRTKAPAERLERTLLDTPPAVLDERTLSDLLTLWVASKAGLSVSGRKDARLAADVVRGRWGDASAADIRPHEVEAWLPSVGGVEWRRKVLRALRGAMSIGGVTMEKVSTGRLVRPQMLFLRVSEVASLAEAIGPKHAAMVWLMATCGPRIGETVSAVVGDVQVDRRRLSIPRTKNGRPRETPLSETVLDMLDLDRDPGSPLFPGRHGKAMSPDAWRQKVFHPAARESGMPAGLRVHDLRHTAASLMILSGATVKDVQAALGHKSAAMTLDMYAGWWDTGLDEVGVRMGRLIADHTDFVPGGPG